MSDTSTETDPAPAVPAVMTVASPQGGMIGIMHLGEQVRAFAADTMTRLRALVSKVAIAEFGMGQQDADALAETAVGTDAQAASSGQEQARLVEQVQALQAENTRLSSMISLAGGTVASGGVPATAEAWAAVGDAMANTGSTAPSGVPSTPEAWASIGAAYGPGMQSASTEDQC